MKKCLVLCAMLLFASKSFAHEDYITSVRNGNVKASIISGFEVEERRQIQIIGQLANILSDKLGNKETISIHYKHLYTTPDHPDQYAVNYKMITPDVIPGDVSDINITCYCYKINPANVLKLVEYTITNAKQIKREQDSVSILLPYNRNIRTISIPVSTIQKVLDSETSSEIAETLLTRIYRPLKDGESMDKNNISYYFQNNQYHVYVQERSWEDGMLVHNDVVIKTFDNIFQFSIVGYARALVFDSPNSFYAISPKRTGGFGPRDPVSKRHIIDDDGSTNYVPYNVIPMGGDRICIVTHDSKPGRLYYDEPEARWVSAPFGRPYNMIYVVNNDVLIQNADDILDDAAMKQLGIISE